MRYSKLVLGLALSLLLVTGAIPFAPFAIRPAFATITHVGTDKTLTTNSNANPIAITLNQQPLAGDALVIWIEHAVSNWESVSSISGAGITTYGIVARSTNLSENIELWAGCNASGSGGTSLTVTPTNTSDTVEVVVAEFSGINTACTADGSGSVSAPTTNTAPTTPNYTTTNANDLIIAGATIISGTCSGGTLTAADSSPLAANGNCLAATYSIVSSTGTYSDHWTSASATWIAGIGALQAAVAATPTRGGPDTFPLLGVGNGGNGGGGGIAQPPGNQAMTRDPALQPFATNSPWNYPIGTAASYANPTSGLNSAGDSTNGAFTAIGDNAICEGNIFTGSSTDPSMNIYTSSRTSSGGSTFIYNTNTFTVNMPSSASLQNGCSDEPFVIISADHLSEIEWESAQKDGNGIFNQSSGAAGFMHIDTKGPGWDSTPYSSSVGPGPVSNGNSTRNPDGQTLAGRSPIIGGMIRKGELPNGIPHALQLASFYTDKNRNAPGGTCSAVWPMTATDGYCGNSSNPQYGNFGNMFMGSLLAIQTSYNCAGLLTVEGQHICLALQRYGGYVTDTGGSASGLKFAVERIAQSDLPDFGSYTGHSSNSNYQTDLTNIAGQIKVVTNSYHSGGGQPQTGNKIDGGDGTVNAQFIALAFDAIWGGGNGRTSYFVPHIPRAVLARFFPMFRIH